MKKQIPTARIRMAWGLAVLRELIPFVEIAPAWTVAVFIATRKARNGQG